MSENQKIFEMLADAELKKILKANWQSAKKALETFAKATGCHN